VNYYCHLYEYRSGSELERFVTPLFEYLGREQRSGNIAVETMRGIVDAVAA
jgi:hypothetical protein